MGAESSENVLVGLYVIFEVYDVLTGFDARNNSVGHGGNVFVGCCCYLLCPVFS